ncbi:hypothetical protein L873DRAFT_1843062 [Choiromyces venosus 120613-1]|uniref:Uncharacterized protein n=1 Tax=Choiromyces venosus 120613-1 TaxID=1336337 RepID=A0A3N4JPZ4_9PEZI|nr:hypothetical protein L873DRAFT_1843062 [Choiromyces venosus 120613-1]
MTWKKTKKELQSDMGKDVEKEMEREVVEEKVVVVQEREASWATEVEDNDGMDLEEEESESDEEIGQWEMGSLTGKQVLANIIFPNRERCGLSILDPLLLGYCDPSLHLTNIGIGNGQYGLLQDREICGQATFRDSEIVLCAIPGKNAREETNLSQYPHIYIYSGATKRATNE